MEESSAVLFSIGPVEVSGAVVTTWVIIALLALLSWLATRRLKDVPGPVQTFAEMAVSSLDNFVSGVLGKALATIRAFYPARGKYMAFPCRRPAFR